MKKLLMALPVLLALTACSDPVERAREVEQIERNLPKGCVFKRLGTYAGRPIDAVFCRGTVTTQTHYTSNKTTVSHAVVTQVEP